MIKKLSQYQSRPELRYQLDAIQFYLNLFQAHAVFRSAVIVGSFAKGGPDRLSDIDLLVFVDDHQSEEAFSLLEKEEPFSIVHRFSNLDKNGFYCKKTVFENMVSAEVHVFEKRCKFKLYRPYLTLFDHDDFLESIVEEGDPPRHEDFPALSSGGKEMGWALFDLFKWWTRGKEELVRLHLLKIADELRK